MGQPANQIPRRDLLGVLQLLLAQASLVIHRSHLQQDIAFRQALCRQRQDMRAAIDNQRHFVVGKALARQQAFLHQADIQ